MISLQPTGRYINPVLKEVGLMYHKQQSTNKSRRGVNIKAITGSENYQYGSPEMIHVRDTSMEEFFLNICYSLFNHWHLLLFPYLTPPHPPTHSFIQTYKFD